MNSQEDSADNPQQFPTKHPWNVPQSASSPGAYEDPQRPVLPPLAPNAAEAYEHPALPPVSPNPMGFVQAHAGQDANGANATRHEVPALPYQPFAPPESPNIAQPSGRKPRRSWRKAVVFVLFLILLGGGLAARTEGPHLVQKIRLAQYHRTEAKAQADLSRLSGPLAASDVRKLDATSAFFAVFARAAQQRTVQTTTGYYWSDTPNNYRQPDTLSQIGFDYAAKQMSYETNAWPSGTLTGQPDETRCVGGQLYGFQSSLAGLGWTKLADAQGCNAGNILPAGPNDGLNAGGLSALQAQKFSDGLRSSKGLITVNGVSLQQHGGKPYIRFDITVHQKKSAAGYLGMQYFMDAFERTGLDPATQPYAYLGAAAAGMRIAYYVDPATQLPAYAELHSTAMLNAQGQPQKTQTYVYAHVEYSFGGHVPALDLKAHTTLMLSWPSDAL